MSIPIIEKIEKIRTSEKLSLNEFAKKIGISMKTLFAMKSRGSSPRGEFIEAVASCYPQYAFWLITNKTDPPLHIAPGEEKADKDSEIRYKIIQRVAARNMEVCFIKETELKKVIFIQSKQHVNDLAALLLVKQDALYEMSLTPYFINAVWVRAGDMNFHSDHGGRISLQKFRYWLSSVNADLIETAEYWLMEEVLFDNVYKVLLIPRNSLLPPDKSAFNFERFELWRQGKAPYDN